jgi:hypothetical protein
MNLGNYLNSLGYELKSGLRMHKINLFLLGVILKKLINKEFYIPPLYTVWRENLVWIVKVILTFGVFILLPLLSYNFDTVLGITVLFIGCCFEFKLVDDKMKYVDIAKLIISLPKIVLKNIFSKNA